MNLKNVTFLDDYNSMKNFSLDIVRVTEMGAIAASHWIGSGNKELADKAATDAMRAKLNTIEFSGMIAIGEGIKDGSYGLFKGELVGNVKSDKPYHLAIDPIEGTTPTVTSGPEAISTIAIGERDSMYAPDCFYVNKMAYGEQIRSKVKLDIDAPIEDTCQTVAKVTGKPLDSIMVCILNRPRHKEIIQRLRNIGVRIKLIQDCDVSGAIAACLPDSGVDLLYGIGGSPEAVISASAIKCLNGDFQVKVVNADTWTTEGKVLEIEDLVKGPCAFVATGITNGSILKGVVFNKRGPITNSVFMRSESGTIRWLTTEHKA